jgi:hypothetical protein
MGNVNTNQESQPEVIPELQNRSVISIVLGDYHYGALTADGQLLTWGQYSHGALGLGMPTELPLGTPGGYLSEAQLGQSRRSQWGPLTPPVVTSPFAVHFNHGQNPGGRRFCFAATAAGWHTGALVVCLEVSFPLLIGYNVAPLTCATFSSPRKRYMKPVPKMMNFPRVWVGLDYSAVAMTCHLGARTHHPYLQTPARSDLAEYSGSVLQGVAGVHRERKIGEDYTVLCYITKMKHGGYTPSGATCLFL